MTIELMVLIAASAAAVAAAPLVVARARRQGRSTRTALVPMTLLMADWWLWQAAFASAFGPQHWLVAPLTLVNAVVAFGAIYSLTGFGLHSDAPLVRARVIPPFEDDDQRY